MSTNVRESLGLKQQQCEMCKTSSWKSRRFYKWVGIITESVCIICEKCAIREMGKKEWGKIKDELQEGYVGEISKIRRRAAH